MLLYHIHFLIKWLNFFKIIKKKYQIEGTEIIVRDIKEPEEIGEIGILKQIHKDIKSKRSIGMHWGTFILTDEPMREPVEKLKQLTKQKNMPPEEFAIMEHGKTIRM